MDIRCYESQVCFPMFILLLLGAFLWPVLNGVEADEPAVPTAYERIIEQTNKKRRKKLYLRR